MHYSLPDAAAAGNAFREAVRKTEEAARALNAARDKYTAALSLEQDARKNYEAAVRASVIRLAGCDPNRFHEF